MRQKNKERQEKEDKLAAKNQKLEDEKNLQDETMLLLVAEHELTKEESNITTEKKNIRKDDINKDEFRIRRVRAYQEVKELWSKQGKKSLDQPAPPGKLHSDSYITRNEFVDRMKAFVEKPYLERTRTVKEFITRVGAYSTNEQEIHFFRKMDEFIPILCYRMALAYDLDEESPETCVQIWDSMAVSLGSRYNGLKEGNFKDLFLKQTSAAGRRARAKYPGSFTKTRVEDGCEQDGTQRFPTFTRDECRMASVNLHCELIYRHEKDHAFCWFQLGENMSESWDAARGRILCMKGHKDMAEMIAGTHTKWLTRLLSTLIFRIRQRIIKYKIQHTKSIQDQDKQTLKDELWGDARGPFPTPVAQTATTSCHYVKEEVDDQEEMIKWQTIIEDSTTENAKQTETTEAARERHQETLEKLKEAEKAHTVYLEKRCEDAQAAWAVLLGELQLNPKYLERELVVAQEAEAKALEAKIICETIVKNTGNIASKDTKARQAEALQTATHTYDQAQQATEEALAKTTDDEFQIPEDDRKRREKKALGCVRSICYHMALCAKANELDMYGSCGWKAEAWNYLYTYGVIGRECAEPKLQMDDRISTYEKHPKAGAYFKGLFARLWAETAPAMAKQSHLPLKLALQLKQLEIQVDQIDFLTNEEVSQKWYDLSRALEHDAEHIDMDQFDEEHKDNHKSLYAVLFYEDGKIKRFDKRLCLVRCVELDAAHPNAWNELASLDGAWNSKGEHWDVVFCKKMADALKTRSDAEAH